MVEQVKVEQRILFLYYQRLLKKQVDWLITQKSYPKELEDCAKSLWILWVSLLGDLCTDSFMRSISAHYTLVFCYLAANSIGIGLTIQETVQLPLEPGFPYFIPSEQISTALKPGGYCGLPDVTGLLQQVAIITNRIAPHLKVPIEPQQTILVVKMFRILGIPLQLYSKFKFLYFFHPKSYLTESKVRILSSICLLISKIFDCFRDEPPRRFTELRYNCLIIGRWISLARCRECSTLSQ